MTSKTKVNTVSVPFAELLKFAAAPKMKRMPRGVKGHIEKHTIIEFHPTFLVVDAPIEELLRKEAQGKIKCGRAHFEALGADTSYVVASNMDTLMDQVTAKLGQKG